MFSKFTRTDGTRVIFVRSDCIISLGDGDDGDTILEWENGRQGFMKVAGTAQENLDRLKAEELAAIDEANRHAQRAEQRLPIVPVRRGRL